MKMNTKEKEQALALSALYKELAEQGTWFEDCCDMSWKRAGYCPNVTSKLHNWRVAKKQDKIIDMSCLVGSNIDMQFSDGDTWTGWYSQLENFDASFHYSKTGSRFKHCRIRQDHWHSWQGGECPLPDGLIVSLQFRNNGGDNRTTNYYSYAGWGDTCEYDIIAFKVLGPAEGWKYE